MTRTIWEFEDTLVDLDKAIMIKSYPDHTIAITFAGNEKAYRFGPLDETSYDGLINAWVNGGEG